ncbi:MAG: translation initiation factor IF-2 [Elusimicrobia bacterium]|nr:translation initiation factor IF-2 [Candidatus Obscuribacterium magneticum]
MATKKATAPKKKPVAENLGVEKLAEKKEKPKKKAAESSPALKKQKPVSDVAQLKKKTSKSTPPIDVSPRVEVLKPPSPDIPPVKETGIKVSPPPPPLRPPEPITKPAVMEKPKSADVSPVLEEKKELAATMTPATPKKKLQFNEMMTVKDLAAAMDIKVTEMIKKLLSVGTPATINQRISFDVASLVAESFGYLLDLKSIYIDEKKDVEELAGKQQPRPPVVTVMGHVDHGKTSLLDAIRSARVADSEAGGITQHIGAYQVASDKGAITFLDTPGHEAFTAMRARGAMVTDIVVLVVAADDSVMPQTVEAIDHAKAADVQIVVAINKVDLPNANVQRVKQELANYDLVAEDWGGKTIMVEVSAKTRKNIDKLIEMILLEAELLELKANPDRPARGVVLEARMDPRRGITATVLIQSGTLKVGEVVVCGLTNGRIRAMTNDKGEMVTTAGPAAPVAILGLSQIPQAGDQLAVVENDREAREIAERRQQHVKDLEKVKTAHLSLESLHSKITDGKLQDLPIILKADVQGSLQALQDSLAKISGTTIRLHIVHAGIGNINESDVLLAEASDAIVFGFHVKIDASAETEAKTAGVDTRTYKIIYEMLADIRAAMEGLLKPEEREVVKGKAQIKNIFTSSKFGQVAGCMIIEGTLTRGSKARVLRAGDAVGQGTISSLRRFKEDVREVEKGYECGLAIDGFRTFTAGDVIEAFVIEEHARRLEASV